MSERLGGIIGCEVFFENDKRDIVEIISILLLSVCRRGAVALDKSTRMMISSRFFRGVVSASKRWRQFSLDTVDRGLSIKASHIVTYRCRGWACVGLYYNLHFCVSLSVLLFPSSRT